MAHVQKILSNLLWNNFESVFFAKYFLCVRVSGDMTRSRVQYCVTNVSGSRLTWDNAAIWCGVVIRPSSGHLPLLFITLSLFWSGQHKPADIDQKKLDSLLTLAKFVLSSVHWCVTEEDNLGWQCQCCSLSTQPGNVSSNWWYLYHEGMSPEFFLTNRGPVHILTANNTAWGAQSSYFVAGLQRSFSQIPIVLQNRKWTPLL